MNNDIALLVDDNQQYVAQFIQKFSPWLLKRHGLELLGKPSEREGSRYLRSKNGRRVRLLLVDIVLPVSVHPAIKLLRHVKERHPTIKRVAITGRAKRDAVWRIADEQLIDGYIDKGTTEKDDARARKEMSRVLSAPRKADLSASLAEAVRAYVQKNPDAAQKKIYSISGKPITLEEIAKEIEDRTEFGKKQERLIFGLTFRQWSRGRACK
jgi:DNA-binding NarL/FixJ family response regulator